MTQGYNDSKGSICLNSVCLKQSGLIWQGMWRQDIFY